RRPMRRGPKPAKSKEAKAPSARQSVKDDGARVRDLETRLAKALRDKADAQEQQRATSEILRTIAHTQRDMQPVLDALTISATRLCDAVDAYIFRVDGQELRLVAHHGPIAALPIGGCMPLVRETAVGRTVLDARTVHVADVQSEAAEFPVSQ